MIFSESLFRIPNVENLTPPRRGGEMFELGVSTAWKLRRPWAVISDVLLSGVSGSLFGYIYIYIDQNLVPQQ